VYWEVKPVFPNEKLPLTSKLLCPIAGGPKRQMKVTQANQTPLLKLFRIIQIMPNSDFNAREKHHCMEDRPVCVFGL
jgi:hypothetical protein